MQSEKGRRDVSGEWLEVWQDQLTLTDKEEKDGGCQGEKMQLSGQTALGLCPTNSAQTLVLGRTILLGFHFKF